MQPDAESVTANEAVRWSPTGDELAGAIADGERWFASHGLRLPPPLPLPPTIPYRTPLQIGSETPDTPSWMVRGYAALQAITEIDGKIKSSGKTTLVTHLVAAILDGQPFLGQPTTKTKVCYVTEQTPATFREALERAGLMGRGDELRVVFRRDVAHVAWPDLVQTIAADALRDGYGVLIVDTLAKLAGIVNENDSGECALAMVPLQNAAHDGLAIIVCRHDRKAGGDVGESGRGSSAISGDVDIILALRRPEGNQPSTRRVIESLSRYTETPEKVVIELGEDGYVLLGDSEAVALADAVRIVSAHLGGEYEQKESWTTDELVNETELNRAAVQRAIRDLMGRGSVTRSGTGKRGDPYQFTIRESVSALTTMLVGRNESGAPS